MINRCKIDESYPGEIRLVVTPLRGDKTRVDISTDVSLLSQRRPVAVLTRDGPWGAEVEALAVALHTAIKLKVESELEFGERKEEPPSVSVEEGLEVLPGISIG